MNIIEEIKSKPDSTALIERLLSNPDDISLLIDTITTDRSTIKFGCEKALRMLSGIKPQLLYPQFDFFAGLLDSDNNFLKWGAILTIANLTAVDTDGKFEALFDRYYSMITDGQMVAANNTIGASVVIIQNRPELSDRIVEQILKVETAEYLHKGEPSPECRNIACGAAIDFFYKLYPELSRKQDISGFVERQLDNSREKVQKAAVKFMKKYSS